MKDMNKKFPVPCRVNYAPSPYEPDEDGVQDVGYLAGAFGDGRPYRLECWRMDDMVLATVFFSALELSALSRDEAAPLLEREGVLRFRSGAKAGVQIARMKDDAGQDMWALNLLLADRRGVYAEPARELKRYVI